MHFAIIAAGEGSRLRQEGITLPKPLVPIQGLPMIDRLLGIMIRCGAESISIICNSQMTEVQQHLQQYILRHAAQVPIRLVVESTPSSMHSLARLAEVIPEGKVCVTTVDTIFAEAEFSAYIRAFQASDQGLFAVTSFVDDEKPLWVACLPNELAPSDGLVTVSPIAGFYDREDDIPVGLQHLVSGGIYGLHTATAWPVLRQCLAEGQSRMRNYQRALVRAGITLQAYRFGQIMDIDHASDITKAEQWLAASVPKPVLALYRAPEHSPNNVQKDADILRSVVQRLSQQGISVEELSEEQYASLGPVQRSGYSLVLHMARRFSTLNRLQRLDVPVINSPKAVQTTAHSRELTFNLLHDAGLPVPSSWAYDPEFDEMFQCEPYLQQLLPGWVKATRPQGSQPDDVVWVETPLQADTAVLQFAAQQVPDIVVQKHIPGDLLKVYVVADAGAGKISARSESNNAANQLFLRTFYPQEQGYSKFGQAERHNSPLAYYPYSQTDLQQLAAAIARVLNLQIFGFDLIVSPGGSLTIIDINDWPSFSPCREEAADAICQIVACQPKHRSIE